MNSQSKKALIVLLGLLLLFGLILVILYARQRLFTKTEPIVLSS